MRLCYRVQIMTTTNQPAAPRGRWFGIAAVVLAVAAILAFKAKRPAQAETPVAAAASSSAARSVVLVANLAEADEPCVCGKIIRSVRSAGTKGIPVKEIDPEESPELASKYKAIVSPAVIILDGSGKEVRRFEGESNDTLASLQSELDRLPSKTP